MMRLTPIAAAALMVSMPALAQQPGSRQTREFVQAAAQSDQFEVDEATTALAEGQDPKVRAFAEQMLSAHRQTSASLKAAVAKAGLERPDPGVAVDQSIFLAALQSQRSKDFDAT